MIKDIRLPSASAGTFAGYSKINQILTDFGAIEDQLETEPEKHIFQYLREIGNGIIFVQLIERALYYYEMRDMLLVAPFTRQFPRIFNEPDDNVTSMSLKQDDLVKKYANLDLVTIANQFGDTNQAKIAAQGLNTCTELTD